MIRSTLAALTALVLYASPAAHAGTLTYSSANVISAQTVQLGGSALGRTETVSAGEIQLLGINGGTGTLSTFCIDIADWLTPSGQFSTGNYLIGSFADQVNALITHVLPTLPTNGLASAALQVAIWKAEYGSTLTVSGNTGVTNLANTYLGYVQSGTWAADPSMRVVKLAGNGQTQDQAYLVAVPEPSTLALLTLVTLAVIAWHRRTPTKA